jgi:hypothetical protein
LVELPTYQEDMSILVCDPQLGILHSHHMARAYMDSKVNQAPLELK